MTPPKAERLPFDEALQERLGQFRKERGLSMTELGRELGYADGTAVSRYLGGKPAGDVLSLERAAADLLKGVSRRVETRTALFETPITRRLDLVVESLGRMGGIGLLDGASGVGKTCACQLHAMRHPLSVVLAVNEWDRSPNAVANLLLDAVDATSFPKGGNRAVWLADRLRGSRRPVIVDNANRLTLASSRWLFDFAAQSGCPLLLVGEGPELPNLLRADQKLIDFVRVHRTLAFDGRDAAAQMRQTAAAVLGGNPAPEVLDLATAVLAQRGSVRALVHHVTVMRDIQSDLAFGGNEVTAFLSADTQMMRPSKLALAAPQKGGR